MKNSINMKPSVTSAVVGSGLFSAVMMVVSAPSLAASVTLSEDVTLQWDNNITYASGYRLDDPDAGNIGVLQANGDDGNRNFGKGLMQNRLNWISELEISNGDFGVFLRANAFYDSLYKDKQTDNNSPVTSNSSNFNGGSVVHSRYTAGTVDQHGHDVELLDAFVYGSVDLGDSTLQLRAGRQVVSWGEAIFLPNGINFANVPLDASRLNVPGVELKELFLPVGTAYGQLGLSDSLSLEMYYQYEWEPTKIDAAGSYFSTVDFLAEGGENILVPAAMIAADMPGGPAPWLFTPGTSPFATLDRTNDNAPDDSGQYGLALRYLAESLNDTEFAFYFVNYHEKTPQLLLTAGTGGTLDTNWAASCGCMPVTGQPSPDQMLAGALMGLESTGYSLDYVEDVKLYGLSLSTVVGETNVAVEYSYRDGVPGETSNIMEKLPATLMAMNMGMAAPGSEVSGYSLLDVTHTDISLLHFFGPTAFADDLKLTFEAVYDRVNGYQSSELGSALQPVDKSSWGYQMQWEISYNSVLPGLDLVIPVVFNHGVSGDSVFAAGFKEGQKRANVGFKGTYLGEYVVELGYTAFWGDEQRNLLDDRDFVSLTLNYSF